MLSVEIRNYKTISHMMFSFEGFASIIGQNFIGKSAILGAIQACLSNSMDKQAIRLGETFTEVRVIHDRSSLDCFWHYEEGNTFYRVNGELYDKLDGNLPAPLEKLGFQAVKAGESKIFYWHVEQFNPLFMVNSGRSSFATDVLAKIFKIDSVYKAKDFCAKELKDVKAKIKVRKQDIVKATDELAAFAGLPPVQEALVGLSGELADLKTQCARIDAYKDLCARLESTRNGLHRLENLPTGTSVDASGVASSLRSLSLSSRLLLRLRDSKAALGALSQVPGPVPPNGLQEEAARLQGMQSALGRLRAAGASYRALAGTPAKLPGADEVAGLGSRAVKANSLLERYRGAVCEVRALSSVPAALAADGDLGLSRLTWAREALVSLHQRYKAVKLLAGLPSPLGSADTDPSRVSSLRGLSARYREALLASSDVESSLEEATRLRAVLEEKLSSFGGCPLCGSDLSCVVKHV